MAEKQFIQAMNNQVLSFLIGLSIGLLFLLYYATNNPNKVEEVNTVKYDSLLDLKQQKIDSLALFVDSLSLEGQKIDTIYFKIEKNIQKQYENVDTITNSDSLINSIKRSIQFTRTQRD